MANQAFHSASASRKPRRARTKTGRKLERGGYVTAETITLWIVYVFMILGNAFIEAGQLAGTTSATIAYEVFTWFTPAGYTFSIWTLIYIALLIWLVSYTQAAPSRPRRFTATSVLFIVSSVLNVTWLAVWHFDQVAIAFIIILVEWAVLAALYINVRRTAATSAGRVPLSIYAAWITVAALANMAILITRALDGGIAFFNGLSVLALTAGVLALGYVMHRTYHDSAFSLVFLWAIVGIGVHVAEVSTLTAVLVFILAAIGGVLTFVPLDRLKTALRR